MATTNRNLNTAKSGKNDEFYTKLYDVVMGLNPIRSYFRNRDILCNCADYNRAFHQYFAMNFVPFGLRSLTVFSRTGKVIRYYGKKKEVIFNGSSGSFTDLRYLTEKTIVVTNPPFSLITDFILLHHKKKHPVPYSGPNERDWLQADSPSYFQQYLTGPLLHSQGIPRSVCH